jgi:hypothetical protein
MKSRFLSAALYALGILHWFFFFNFGRLSFSAFDWPKEFSYLSVIRQALVRGVIPYHTSVAFQTTDRFLALPETLLSPQIALLPFMGIGAFILTNTLIMYSVGFAGSRLLAQRYRFSPLVFTVLFLLFNLNGYITSHLAVGHFMWLGYFLLPFFFLILLELIEGKEALRSSFKLFLLLFVMNLQGAFHIFVWCVIFLILVALVNRTCRKPILLALLLAFLSSAFRLAPAAVTFYHKGHPFVFIMAYPTLFDLGNALTVLHPPDYYRFLVPVGWWEFDAYISIIGVIFIGYFGIYARFRAISEPERRLHSAFDIPLIVMLLLSSALYSWIARLPVPFINSQRFSSRFIIIPLVMLIIISCVRLQAVIKELTRTQTARLGMRLLAALMALLLLRHSYLWRIAGIENSMALNKALTAVTIVSKPDPFYSAVVRYAFLASLASILAAAVIGSRLRQIRSRADRDSAINAGTDFLKVNS